MLKDAFRVVGIQKNNTLILRDDNFAKLKKEKLKEAKLSTKPTENLLYKVLLIFNSGIV